MDSVEILGFVAGIMVALSSLPQFIKSLKTKSTKDVSLLWLLVNITGQGLWIFYGYFKASPSLMVMSTITFFMVMAVLVLKLKYDKK